MRLKKPKNYPEPRRSNRLELENSKLQTSQCSSVRYLEWQQKTFPEVSQDEQDRLIKLRLESETQYSSEDRQLLDKLLVGGSIQTQKNLGDFHNDFPSTKGMTSYAIRMAKGGYNKRGGIVATIPSSSLDEGSDLDIHLDDFGLLSSTGEWGNDEVYQALITYYSLHIISLFVSMLCRFAIL